MHVAWENLHPVATGQSECRLYIAWQWTNSLKYTRQLYINLRLKLLSIWQEKSCLLKLSASLLCLLIQYIEKNMETTNLLSLTPTVQLIHSWQKEKLFKQKLFPSSEIFQPIKSAELNKTRQFKGIKLALKMYLIKLYDEIWISD